GQGRPCVAAKRVERSQSRPGRQECLLHVATVDNVKAICARFLSRVRLYVDSPSGDVPVPLEFGQSCQPAPLPLSAAPPCSPPKSSGEPHPPPSSSRPAE